MSSFPFSNNFEIENDVYDRVIHLLSLTIFNERSAVQSTQFVFEERRELHGQPILASSAQDIRATDYQKLFALIFDDGRYAQRLIGSHVNNLLVNEGVTARRIK